MHLTAAGMVCPVGLSAKAACAAMRAGIAGFTELPFHDRQNEPIIGAATPAPGLGTRRHTRLVKLLTLALEDLLRNRPNMDWRRVPLLVGLAEVNRPGGADDLTATVVSEVQQLLGIKFHPKLSIALPQGHVAGFAGLRLARDLDRSGSASMSLVCGVDSYLNGAALDWLEEKLRLKTPDNTDGVIPGEAAAAVLVESQSTTDAAQVVGLGFGLEKASVLTEEPLLGLGLADAGRKALAEAGWGFHEIDFRLSDVTGENYGFREHTLAHARLMRVVRLEDHPLWHPADSIGDTGAAAGVVQLVMAAAAWGKAYAPGARAACFTSAVPGERAVALLRHGRA
jgi:3-oxoacyl-[acyl-carrier-protein] synthase I